MMKVKKWEDFQHYKDRNPPWIKLATDLFQDYEFSTLSDASKLLAVCIWTLASRYKDPKLGLVPDDIDWIKKQCGLGNTINDKCLQELEKSGFIVRDSKSLAKRKQSARPETETEGETYSKEKEAFSIDDAVCLYNETAGRAGLPKVLKVSDTRKAKLKARLKDCDGIEGWKAALSKLENSSFCKGENNKGWAADFDFLITEGKFISLMEGKYDGTNTATTKTDRAREAIARANTTLGGM